MNIGFIADEVLEEMSVPDRKGIEHASAVGFIVRSVQELSEKNLHLEQENHQLKEALANVISRLEQLERKK
ncbi:hypothetical protein [Chitinophaga sp. sic0106]|uniref:hypothetical protein n=1 Tax=Chitinophaga sp. sic0106 TaxID=2854785 RepID=UPI001C48FEAB|nr:hypothetical protein [Chitinophaga sp. sic0106]MBV7531759.1 hypothetical protein [Chitinophaga sp. sic0106]